MSLRTRLTLFYVGFFAIALMTLHGGLYLVVRQSLISSIDNELRLGAQLLQQGFEKSNPTVLAALDGDRIAVLMRQPPVRDFEATNLFAQVYQDDGERVGSSPNLPTPLELDREIFDRVRARETLVRTVELEGGRLRELVTPLMLKGQVVGVLHVARSLNETDRALNLLLYALSGGGVLVLLAAARGGAWLTRAAFRPIDEIAATAQSIVRAEDLSRRVPVPEAEDELKRLTVTVNELLTRLEALFGAQRRFIADVSHELRTPLAAMQGNLDVLARGASQDPQLLGESITDMRREVARLIRMTNDLLLLARTDSGFVLRREPVELDTLLLEVHRELIPLANQVQLCIGEEDQVSVPGDRDRIKQALLNLSVNALQHTPPGGRVTLGLATDGGYAALSVSDTGSGITAADLPYIFDRFYRADYARSHDRGGVALGLSIVRWIAEAHHGTVRVSSTPGAGSTFTLLLPIDPLLQPAHHAEAVLGE
ncbi:MAG TPA: ATP-binding protein [Roseiflexaceae bacterium]|nr:ATP-binding protein [Roseiflexaceae bacterium]